MGHIFIKSLTPIVIHNNFRKWCAQVVQTNTANANSMNSVFAFHWAGEGKHTLTHSTFIHGCQQIANEENCTRFNATYFLPSAGNYYTFIRVRILFDEEWEKKKRALNTQPSQSYFINHRWFSVELVKSLATNTSRFKHMNARFAWIFPIHTSFHLATAKVSSPVFFFSLCQLWCIWCSESVFVVNNPHMNNEHTFQMSI